MIFKFLINILKNYFKRFPPNVQYLITEHSYNSFPSLVVRPEMKSVRSLYGKLRVIINEADQSLLLRMKLIIIIY